MNPVNIMSRTFHLTRKQGAIEAGEPYTCNVKAPQKRKKIEYVAPRSDTNRYILHRTKRTSFNLF